MISLIQASNASRGKSNKTLALALTNKTLRAKSSPMRSSFELACRGKATVQQAETLYQAHSSSHCNECKLLEDEKEVCLKRKVERTTYNPMFPKLSCVSHMLLIPIILSVEGGVKAFAAKISHIPYFVFLELARV